MRQRILLLILLAVVAIGGSAQTVSETMFIYRNDGQFNSFFRDDIDSITYSYYDNDSVRYDDIVAQLVYTADSIYHIPLSAIDSISFVQPNNILKSGVINLTGAILDYLVKYENGNLYFLSATPNNIVPHIGDKLVTIDMTEMFPCGFAGEVASIENSGDTIIVACNGLELEDVFDSYCYTVDIASSEDSISDGRAEAKARKPSIDQNFTIPKLSHSWSVGAGYSIFNVSGNVESSLSARFNIKGNDIVEPKRGRLTNIRVTGNYTSGTSFDIGISASKTFDFPFPGGKGERLIAPFLSFFWDLGVFVRVSGGVNYSQSTTQTYVSHIDYQRESIKMPNISFDTPTMIGEETSEAKLALNGSVSGGFYGELGIKPWAVDKDALGKVSGRLELGIEAKMEEGVFSFDALNGAASNTVLFDFIDNLGDKSVTINPYASVKCMVKVGSWNTSWTPWKGKIGIPIYEGGFFPHFSNTSYERTNESGNIKFSSDVSRLCLFPWEIGFSVFDTSGNFIKTKWFDKTYSSPMSFKNYEVNINGLDKDEEYKVYPSINVFGHNVLASPAVTVRACPVEISDFKVINSQYEAKGFVNDGMTYDYCFDVSVTATLTKSDNVRDWGYVYRDPNGREKEISLVSVSNYGTQYTDTRYSYYRNVASSTACLYGYVRYVDSDEAVYGEPQYFDLTKLCPDDNHPHMIDLGLGVKWACCNVGATAPEEYGGYYAWGGGYDEEYIRYGYIQVLY